MGEVITIPDTADDFVELVLGSRIEELSRDRALAESRIEQLQFELIATGVMDPELGP
jgi:hypothetical protein